jgi:broad specificity phosphatase PhoE
MMATASNSRARQTPGREVAVAGDREPAILLSNAFPVSSNGGQWQNCGIGVDQLNLLGSTRVLLMRHADVENPNRILYGHLPGFRLSALGRAQATAVGESLRNAGIRRILHSPLDRARETAELVDAQLPAAVPLIAEAALREAEIGRYLQGVPYWQIPIRRPRWFVHKLRRGSIAGDETIAQLGGRIIGVLQEVARDHPGEVSLLVSHADPIQAAWVLMDGRPQTERELYRKSIGRAAMLQIDLDGERVVAIHYQPAPKVSVPGLQ